MTLWLSFLNAVYMECFDIRSKRYAWWLQKILALLPDRDRCSTVDHRHLSALWLIDNMPLTCQWEKQWGRRWGQAVLDLLFQAQQGYFFWYLREEVKYLREEVKLVVRWSKAPFPHPSWRAGWSNGAALLFSLSWTLKQCNMTKEHSHQSLNSDSSTSWLLALWQS